MIRSKNKNRDVVLLSLGSSNCFGEPLKFPLVYDVLSKREMQNHKIDFYNAIDLSKMFQHKTFAPVEGDNRQIVMKTNRRQARGSITVPERNSILEDAGIDIPNAIVYYNENLSSNAPQQRIDVYIALVEFVKKHRGKDISVDEMPILMNPKSKIINPFSRS